MAIDLALPSAALSAGADRFARAQVVLQRIRAPLSDEKRTQAVIGAGLLAAAIPFERECRLSTKDIVDFLLFPEEPDAIGVEVKLRSSGPMAVWRQLERYASSPRVAGGLILVTNRAMRLPPNAHGVPLALVALGLPWL